MVHALRRLGVDAKVSTIPPLPADAPSSLREAWLPWPQTDERHCAALLQGWRGPGLALRKRLASYQGLELSTLAGAIALVDRLRPQAVIGLGQHSTLMLRALSSRPQVRRVWYAADELVRFHMTCLVREAPRAWPERFRRLIHHALMERLFTPDLDGAVAVSPVDARCLRLIAGVPRSITIRNGVDFNYFQPSTQTPRPRSLVFWGRLDFEPNIDAVQWFAREIWPQVRTRWPDASWTIIGKGAGPGIRSWLQTIPGVDMLGEVADLRPRVANAVIAILPMRCGGGIKNKLLEAAAMGKPILASPRAVDGLDAPTDSPPWLVCRGVSDWLENLDRLWSHPAAADDLGKRALAWVRRHHNWDTAAARLIEWVGSLPHPHS